MLTVKASSLPVTFMTDIPYRAGDPDARLDVYAPLVATNRPLYQQRPTLIWAHGGGWASGNKSLLAQLYVLFAKQGYTVVSLEYSLAPNQQYPTPIVQLNTAMAYIVHHANELHVDPNRLFVVGESAGAQLMGQVANVNTNPDYARQMHLTSGLKPYRLRGAVLICGAYDPLAKDTRIPISQGLRQAFAWYMGTPTIDPHDPRLHEFSVREHMTPAFPPFFVTAGNMDELANQSYKLWARARHLGIPVEALFFPEDYQSANPKKELLHGFQFDHTIPESQLTWLHILAFLQRYSQ